MVQARTISGVTQIEIHPKEHTTKIVVRTESETSNVGIDTGIRHDTLVGRNIPNQHSIDSITGLSEVLSEVSDKSFIFEQSIASDTWHIEHTLNKRASCVAVDSAGNVQIPNEIRYISDNEILVTFLAPFAGKAYLN